ncbi:FAD-dependent oxidoreductase [Nocardioides mangrovicus]|uniref:FAD-dependent oxidoreductase n=1 Tax=Nocardioides mangrovicus TaxID=2478913 RepID=UPI001314DCBF|nr:FAD-dependent oxidoreductase [Nocardioides mangrovicus]
MTARAADAAYVVVGAGPSGLGCASELLHAGPVTVIDRIPVTGGTAGWENPLIKDLTRDVVSRGAHFALGQTAVRYDGATLTVASPTGFQPVATRHLVFAGGLRPGTPADLHIDGYRPAGVVPATVAEHLLRTGVQLWTHAVILGNGPWARPVAELCRKLGTRVTVVADLADVPDWSQWADKRIDATARVRVAGRDRISGVELTTADGTTSLTSCDALVLAADPRPNRNVVGALTEDDPNVLFHQPTQPTSPRLRYDAAARATRSWLQTIGGPS